MNKLDTVHKFARTLDDEGEMFFTSGDTNTDYEIIMRALRSQGYWAGIKYKYYFDNNLNLIKAEERRLE